MRIDELLALPGPCFSVEFFPPKTQEGRETLFETVEVLSRLGPSFFSVTYGAGGATREGTVEITRAIRAEYGVEAMAHLSCVGETQEALGEIVDEIAGAGIENILALRGDPPRGQTDFEQPTGGLGSAAELTRMIGQSHPEIAIGGACFPEVHPEAANMDADIAYLKTKVDNRTTFLITQLFFDNAFYYDFVARARELGIEVPIVPGIMPITNYGQIRRITEMCGSVIPAHLVADLARDLHGSLARRPARSVGDREEARAELAKHVDGLEQHLVALLRLRGEELDREDRPRGGEDLVDSHAGKGIDRPFRPSQSAFTRNRPRTH